MKVRRCRTRKKTRPATLLSFPHAGRHRAGRANFWLALLLDPATCVSLGVAFFLLACWFVGTGETVLALVAAVFMVAAGRLAWRVG